MDTCELESVIIIRKITDLSNKPHIIYQFLLNIVLMTILRNYLNFKNNKKNI